MSEEEMIRLVILAQQKDESAFTKLYEQYHRLVLSQAYKATGSYSEAQDIAQEVFLQLHKSIDRLREPKLFPIWVHRITYSKCAEVFRKKRPDYMEPEAIADMGKQDDHKDFNPHNYVRFQDDRQQLEFFISCLKEKEQEIIRGVYLEQKTIKELSHMYQIPEGTVKTRAFQARKKLKKMIVNYEKSNNIKLDFHSSTASALLSFPLFIAFKNWLKEHQKLLIKTSHLFVAAGAVVLFVEGTQVILPEITKEETMPKLLEKEKQVTTVNSFPAIQVNEITYTTPADAYQGLLQFSTQEDLVTKTKEECLVYQELITAMEAYGGAYYQNLVKSGWIKNYTAIITKK